MAVELARHVVNTDASSIIEELLPVAIPEYGGAPLDRDTTRALLHAPLGELPLVWHNSGLG